MDEHYIGREQTLAKHMILKGYLSAFSAKLINFSNLAYIDAFSGPWNSSSIEHKDTSFRIAIDSLLEAQRTSSRQGKAPKLVRCFFSEKNSKAYQELSKFLDAYRDLENFEVKDYNGSFEEAIPEIQSYIQGYFPLFFIDPTGWTGISLDKLKPLFQSGRSEILFNFMYDFINRGVSMDDPGVIASFNGLFGGADWPSRLDPNLQRGLASLKLFKLRLKETGNFKYVVSANIVMSTKDRTHFTLVYGTKNYIGLKVFRDQEFKAKHSHEMNRLKAKRRSVEKTSAPSFFPLLDDLDHTDLNDDARVKDEIEKEIQNQRVKAEIEGKQILSHLKKIEFTDFAGRLLEEFSLRETHVKDICIALAKAGCIEDTWTLGKKRKPDKGILLRVVSLQSHT